MAEPLIMTEEYWADSYFSVARYTNQIQFNSTHYIIVDKLGRDIFECSRIADKEGRAKAIEPGEPCDLCRMDLVPSYRALGRNRILELIKQGKSAEEIKEIAGFGKKTKRKKK